MRSVYVDRAKKLISEWRQEAERRRARTPSDPAAETLLSCANELELMNAEVDRDTQSLTAAQYAESHNVTPQTVRRWIRAGELSAEDTPNGWMISRDAVRVVPINRPTLDRTGT